MIQTCSASCPSAKRPFAGFYEEEYQSGQRVVFEPGDVNRLVFVLSGECVVNSEECDNYQVGGQKIFFCYKHGHYTVDVKQSTKVVIATFTNPGAACDDAAMLQHAKENPGFHYHFAAYPIEEPMAELIGMVRRYLADGIPCAHMHESAIEMLFIVFRFYYDIEDLENLFFNLFDHTLSFRTMVEGNRIKARNLNHLAELCGYDINTFNVVFRRHYPGYTPGVWMQIQRKDEILADLADTDAPIYYISNKYGFSSSSHLGEYCKKYLGDTPTKIRAKYKGKKK